MNRGPKVVRHNQHVFTRNHVYSGGLDPQIRVSFICQRCGLKAAADRVGQVWKNWIGEGAKTSCGDQIAKQVMES